MENRIDQHKISVDGNSIITRTSPTGAAAAPVNNIIHRHLHSSRGASSLRGRSSSCSSNSSASATGSAPSSSATPTLVAMSHQGTPPTSLSISERQRSLSRESESSMMMPGSPLLTPNGTTRRVRVVASPKSPKKKLSNGGDSIAKAKARSAQKQNDSMVYLDGPQVYTCGQCRTHLTSHDDIISKSFHGRHGRAYLFDQCVNITIGPAEDRVLITGLHSVCDIFCKRCKGMIGWTYAKAYEQSQKYKEGKYIIEKINLHLEESAYYDVDHPAGERPDRWRKRSMSWGSEQQHLTASPRSPGGRTSCDIVYEYHPTSSSSVGDPQRYWEQQRSSSSLGSSEHKNKNDNTGGTAPRSLPALPFS